MPERLNPGISAHTTVSPCVTSAGGTRCQVPDVPGWPCSSTAGPSLRREGRRSLLGLAAYIRRRLQE